MWPFLYLGENGRNKKKEFSDYIADEICELCIKQGSDVVCSFDKEIFLLGGKVGENIFGKGHKVSIPHEKYDAIEKMFQFFFSKCTTSYVIQKNIGDEKNPLKPIEDKVLNDCLNVSWIVAKDVRKNTIPTFVDEIMKTIKIHGIKKRYLIRVMCNISSDYFFNVLVTVDVFKNEEEECSYRSSFHWFDEIMQKKTR